MSDMDIVAALRYADVMGVCPPQNWTMRAANELELCRNRIAQLEAALKLVAKVLGEYRILDMPIEQRIAELEATVNRLRGQLQNCVNHLERAKRRSARTDDFDACIESANKALYETVEVK